ncbi:hypothetical protein [Nucisporomicrobium flavum]|uniref:hypothetical protein n=1 Tax=Nucisporomicrobium flavum TaxID=2785915 RepID=UPI0018F4415E|nr:hypothetical protein [Nucisporomicrobium flavum]
MRAHRHHTSWSKRIADARAVLRGRPPRFDYGLLVVMPFIAAAGGVLISLAIEDAVERRRAHRPGHDGARRTGTGSTMPLAERSLPADEAPARATTET